MCHGWLADLSPFQDGYKLHLGKSGLKLLAVILVLQPGITLGWRPAIQNQPARTTFILHLDDGLFQLVRVGLLFFLLGASTLFTLAGFGVGYVGDDIDRVLVELLSLVDLFYQR